MKHHQPTKDTHTLMGTPKHKHPATLGHLLSGIRNRWLSKCGDGKRNRQFRGGEREKRFQVQIGGGEAIHTEVHWAHRRSSARSEGEGASSNSKGDKKPNLGRKKKGRGSLGCQIGRC